MIMVISMKKYINDYIGVLNSKLDKKITEKDINELLNKIRFFSHERLIHLLVTLFYAVFILLSIFITKQMPLFALVILILLIFFFCYVRHYFFLENGVQYLYQEYDKMMKLKNK